MLVELVEPARPLSRAAGPPDLSPRRRPSIAPATPPAGRVRPGGQPLSRTGRPRTGSRARASTASRASRRRTRAAACRPRRAAAGRPLLDHPRTSLLAPGPSAGRPVRRAPARRGDTSSAVASRRRSWSLLPGPRRGDQPLSLRRPSRSTQPARCRFDRAQPRGLSRRRSPSRPRAARRGPSSGGRWRGRPPVWMYLPRPHSGPRSRSGPRAGAAAAREASSSAGVPAGRQVAAGAAAPGRRHTRTT